MYKEAVKDLHSGKIYFFLLAASLIVGFFFNEDASGGGSAADFYNTWGYNLALKENLFIDSSPWTDHFPLHHIFLSRLHYLISDEYFIRLFFCIFSISVPFLFLLNLQVKFEMINKNILWFLASLIFILPSFRYSAIWANDHITSFFFILLSTLFFLKWDKKKNYESLDINIILQVFFLSLAVYCRQYYALLFLYFMFVYLQKLKLKAFIILSFLVFFLSLPGIWIVYNQQNLISLYSTSRFADSLLVNSSILSFYLIPIFFCLFINKRNQLSDNKKFFIFSVFISTVVVYILSLSFDYNFKVGGGFLLKLSILLFDNNYLFYLSSILGFVLLSKLSWEDKNNFILIFLILFGFSGYTYNFQKYYEPLFLFIFFLLLNSKFSFNFLKSYKNLIFLNFYVLIYLILAIINDIYRITENI